MKIKFQNYIRIRNMKYLVVAAYFRSNKWFAYEGSLYHIKNKKEAKELIQEVSEEMHVPIKNIKLVTPNYITFNKAILPK